jgi:hypothetical protein
MSASMRWMNAPMKQDERSDVLDERAHEADERVDALDERAHEAG